ncbi:MAG: hypothetical protein GY870_12220 [archaeon]|nr:hypothetical protein [archaeon]
MPNISKRNIEKRGYDLKDLASKIESIKTIESNKKIGFDAFKYEQYSLLLKNILKPYDNRIPEKLWENIIWKTVTDLGRKGKISSDDLLNNIKKNIDAYLSNPLEKYVVATTLSVNNSFKLGKLVVDGVTITFNKNFLSKFILERNRVIKPSYKRYIPFPPPEKFVAVKIHLQSRHHVEAFEKAIDTLDFVRGVWNYFINREIGSSKTTGQRLDSINSIVLGPVHTVHYSSGNIATEMYWYENDYTDSKKTYDRNDVLNEIYLQFFKFRKILKKITYQAFIKEGLIKYNRALDSTNYHKAFMSLWSALEFLTKTGENDNHKVTVRRSCSLYIEPKFSRQILNSLREFRNSIVHENSSSSNIEPLVYQLRFIRLMRTFFYEDQKVSI